MNINTVSLYNLFNTEVEYTECEKTVKVKTPSHDESFGLFVKNSNISADATITIKGGNSVMAAGDSLVTVKKGSETLINLKDTGRHKNVYGENAGYVVIEIEGVEPSDISVFAFSL